MRTRRRAMIEMYGLVFLIGAIGTACAQDAKPAYPIMAAIGQYREANASAEIELAKTAAPTSISGDASVLVMGNHEYETAVKGKNGFVCLVWRSWAATLNDPDFWNAKFRAPICFNHAAVRTVLPAYLERTKWALAGASKAEIESRIRAELASNRIATPDPGALAYMMSKEGDTGSGHHFPPHVMTFLAHTEGADWGAGAGFHGSPIIVEQQYPEPFTVFDVKVPLYSDGTPATMGQH